MKKNHIFLSVTIVAVLMVKVGCSKENDNPSPLSDKAYTTVDQMIVPKIDIRKT